MAGTIAGNISGEATHPSGNILAEAMRGVVDVLPGLALISLEILSLSNPYIGRYLATVRMEKDKSERCCANSPEGAD